MTLLTRFLLGPVGSEVECSTGLGEASSHNRQPPWVNRAFNLVAAWDWRHTEGRGVR